MINSYRMPVIIATTVLLAALVLLWGGGCNRNPHVQPSVEAPVPPAEETPSTAPNAPTPHSAPETPAPSPGVAGRPGPLTSRPMESPQAVPATPRPLTAEDLALRAQVVRAFSGETPKAWGTSVPGVRTRLQTSEPVIALTFDACGTNGPGRGYDAELIDFLEREQIPATFFWTARWIDANPGVAQELARNPLFEIENHGWLHRPGSVTGRAVYGITGTRSVGDLADEALQGAASIEALTGRRPHFFRAGTAYYDDVAVRVLQGLGLEVAGYSVLGDAGATYSAAQVARALEAAAPGDIVICHMNHPEGQTAEGIEAAIPRLRARGFRFVKLSDFPLH